MPGLVGQFPVSAFTDPQSGQQKNVSVIRGNDNTVGTAITGHDAAATIHVQSSTLASRPAAGTAQRFWVTTDGKRAYLDNGTTWDELVYVPIVGSAAKLPYGSVPGSPADGDTWVTSAGLFTRVGGVTKGPYIDSAGTAGKVPRWATGTTLGDSGMTDNGTITNNVNNPRCRTTKGSFLVGTGSIVQSWDSAPVNVGTMWAAGNPTRWTIPSAAGGGYLFSLSCSVTNSAAIDTYAIKLRKNGTTDVTANLTDNVPTGGGSSLITLTFVDEATAADYYEWHILVGNATNTQALTYGSAAKLW